MTHAVALAALAENAARRKAAISRILGYAEAALTSAAIDEQRRREAVTAIGVRDLATSTAHLIVLYEHEQRLKTWLSLINGIVSEEASIESARAARPDQSLGGVYC